MNNDNQKKPFVSVIIPVYNDKARLELCLEALSKQSYWPELYEIIVVDNGSDEDLKDIVFSGCNVSIYVEETPGSYAARNKGIDHAKGEILAFTDADCLPEPSWIEAGVDKLLSTSNCGLVAGKIELFFKDAKQLTTVEVYESIELDFPQDRLLETEHFGVTANLFTYRSVVDKIGTFNTNLKSGGDKEWGNRVFEAGYQQAYAEGACIKHPARYSWSQLYKRVTRINGGLHDRRKVGASFQDKLNFLTKDLVLALTPPFRSFFQIWSDERLIIPKQKFQFILAMLFVRYVSAWERIRLTLGGESRRW
jgi:glycosyltransferase involved in cell wall biosynthesis